MRIVIGEDGEATIAGTLAEFEVLRQDRDPEATLEEFIEINGFIVDEGPRGEDF